MQNSEAVLTTRDLQKTFGEEEAKVSALRNVTMSVHRGEFLSIMGPSGSGKTTLLTLLGGIDLPTSGEVFLEGEDLAKLDDARLCVIRRRKIGFVFQNLNLLPILTAEANIMLPLLLDQKSKSESRERALELMERMRISDRRTHLPSSLSGGEQQRVAICRALAAKPPILLADEPTGSLDTANSRALIELLRTLVDEGQTIAMVTHDVNAALLSDRALLFRDGAVSAEIAKSEIDADHLTQRLQAS